MCGVTNAGMRFELMSREPCAADGRFLRPCGSCTDSDHSCAAVALARLEIHLFTVSVALYRFLDFLPVMSWPRLPCAH